MQTNISTLQLKKIQTDFPNIKISNSKQSSDFIRQFYGDDIGIFESFYILLLNQSMTTIAYQKISQGGVSGTVVDVRLIAKYAVGCLASHVILAHNHPGGTLKPSKQDLLITKKTVDGLKLLDIHVLDHVILTEDGYYSFADNHKII